MRTKRILSTLLLAAFPLTGLAAGPAAPEGDASFVQLRDVAQKAIVNNPEVNAKYHNFRASVEEVGVAFGGYLPRVDVVAGAGSSAASVRSATRQPVARPSRRASAHGGGAGGSGASRTMAGPALERASSARSGLPHR